MMALGRWILTGIALIALAIALHSVFPFIKGHIAMGLAAILPLSAMYLGKHLDDH